MKSLLVGLLMLGLTAAGCGDGDDGGGAANSTSDDTTVSVRDLGDAGQVLVDSKGAALYTSDQEAGGTVRCTGSCASIWLPLTIPPAGDGPSGPTEVEDGLGVTKRGSEDQVTYKGKPLYRFAQDPTGRVTGNGLADEFGGRHFRWRVVTASGMSEAPDRPYGGTGGY